MVVCRVWWTLGRFCGLLTSLPGAWCFPPPQLNAPCEIYIVIRTLTGWTHIPVHADGTEVEYGCGAQHHIHGHQAIAHQHVQGPNSALKLHKHTHTQGQKHTNTESLAAPNLSVNTSNPLVRSEVQLSVEMNIPPEKHNSVWTPSPRLTSPPANTERF